MIYAKDCLAKFGEPNADFERKWMVLWQNDIGGAIPKKIYCNKLLLPKLQQALQKIKEAGYLDMIVTWDGCFNVRKSRTSKSYSLHAWGIAFDINAATNQLGHESTQSLAIVKIFNEVGLDFGGLWKLRDPMHWQLKTLDG